MAPSFVAFTATSAGAVEPTGTAKDDLVLALAISGSTSTPGGPAGWTQAGSSLAGNTNVGNVWWIVRGSSAPSLTWTNVSTGGVNLYTFRGMAPVLDAVASGTGASITCPTVNASQSSDWLVCLYADNASTTLTAPGGMTEPGTPASFGALAYLALSSTGATGTKTPGGGSQPVGAWSITLFAAAPAITARTARPRLILPASAQRAVRRRTAVTVQDTDDGTGISTSRQPVRRPARALPPRRATARGPVQDADDGTGVSAPRARARSMKGVLPPLRRRPAQTPPAQVVIPPPPYPTRPTTPRRFLSPVRRGAGRAPVPPQFNPPIPQDRLGPRLRRFAFPIKRATSRFPVQPQLNPPIPQDRLGPRLRRFLPPTRRATARTTVPPQFNPPIPQDRLGPRLRRFAFPVRRATARSINPLPTIAPSGIPASIPGRALRRLVVAASRRRAFAPPMPGAAAPFVPARRRGTSPLRRRASSTTLPVPGQLAPPSSPPRRRAVLPVLRRARAWLPTPAQEIPRVLFTRLVRNTRGLARRRGGSIPPPAVALVPLRPRRAATLPQVAQRRGHAAAPPMPAPDVPVAPLAAGRRAWRVANRYTRRSGGAGPKVVVTPPPVPSGRGGQLRRRFAALARRARASFPVQGGLAPLRDLRFQFRDAKPSWVVGELPSGWTFAEIDTGWVITQEETSVQKASVLSSPYIKYTVAASVNGAVVNPVNDVVKFAFMPRGVDPQVTDWHLGSWETQPGPPLLYVARIQVGPLGVVLTKGVYVVWIQIVDSPETIVKGLGELDIT